MILLFLLIYILFLFINKLVYKKTLNYVNIIISIWILISILTQINPYDMFEIPKKAYDYILRFLLLFEFCSIIFYKIKYKLNTNNQVYINWNLIKKLIFICIIIVLPFSVKGTIVFITQNGFSSLRDAYLNYQICSNKMYIILDMLIFPLGEAIGYYAITDFVQKKKMNSILILFLIFIIEIIFATGGRSRIVYYAILLCIVMIEQSKKIVKLLKNNKKIIITLLILLLVIIGITGQRNLQGKGFIYNLYVYLVGGIQLLGIYLSNPSRFLLQDTNLLYGQVLFSAILFPFMSILRMFNIDVTAGFYIVNEVTSQFLPISNITLINNGGSFIYYALRDFGEIGIIIYTIIIALIFSNLYKKKEKQPNLYNRTIYYFFFIKCLFLITQFTLAQTSALMTIIYFKILSINNKSKTKLCQGSEK